MSFRAVLVCAFLLLWAGSGARAEDADGDDPGPDLSEPDPAVPAPRPSFRLPGSALGLAWLAAGVASAAVFGMVLVSSWSKVRPVPADPLVTVPGGEFPEPRRRFPRAEVPSGEAFAAGREFALRTSPATFEHGLRLMRILGLGEASLVSEREGERVIRVAACPTCGDRPRRRGPANAASASTCGFERGFVAGVLEATLGRDVTVVETRCGGPEERVCEFRARY